MSNADTNMSKSTDGQMSDTTSLSSLTEELTKLEALAGKALTVEKQVTRAASEWLLSEQDEQIRSSLVRLINSIHSSMGNTLSLRSSLTHISKQLNAPAKSTDKLLMGDKRFLK